MGLLLFKFSDPIGVTLRLYLVNSAIDKCFKTTKNIRPGGAGHSSLDRLKFTVNTDEVIQDDEKDDLRLAFGFAHCRPGERRRTNDEARSRVCVSGCDFLSGMDCQA